MHSRNDQLQRLWHLTEIKGNYLFNAANFLRFCKDISLRGSLRFVQDFFKIESLLNIYFFDVLDCMGK